MQITPTIDTTIANTASCNLDGFVTNMSPIQTENVTFGEYKTTTNVGGINSEYMPQIDSTLYTSIQQTPATLPIPSSPIIQTQRVPISPTFTKNIDSPMDISIPISSVPKINISSSMMLPSTASGLFSPPRQISTSRVAPITFSPSQSELIRSQSYINTPQRSPIITESIIYTQPRKIYSNRTYRSILGRKGKSHKHNIRKLKPAINGKFCGTLYIPNDYNNKFSI